MAESESIDGAPERCRDRIPSRTPQYDYDLREEAPTQAADGWLEGPFELSRDAVLHLPDREIRCNPSVRSGVSRGEKLRAGGDPGKPGGSGSNSHQSPHLGSFYHDD